jgi:hypothetical protein
MVEVNGEDNSIDLKNKDLYKRAIIVHGRMEHNLAKYVKYYSCGSKEISGNSEFTRKIDYNRRDFFRPW